MRKSSATHRQFFLFNTISPFFNIVTFYRNGIFRKVALFKIPMQDNYRNHSSAVRKLDHVLGNVEPLFKRESAWRSTASFPFSSCLLFAKPLIFPKRYSQNKNHIFKILCNFVSVSSPLPPSPI